MVVNTITNKINGQKIWDTFNGSFTLHTEGFGRYQLLNGWRS